MSRADLFVVCKNPECGAEVSPYITECPYCGTRLQKRAPKLDKALRPARRARRMPTPSLGRLRPGEIPGIRADSHPFATGAIILATCGVWIATRGGWLNIGDVIVQGKVGSVGAPWWHALTAPFAYFSFGDAGELGAGVYQFATLLTVAVFGWLLERRHGPLAVLVVFLAGSVGGIIVGSIVDPLGPPYGIAGGNGGALALLCAWAVPDLLARRRGQDYSGDLLGTGAIALVMLAMPLVRHEASAVAGGVGVGVGYLAGLPLARRQGH
ncbi:MAG: rhomboid family intramembrane serine protease [Solirubrobacteraceae bacterium]